MNIDVKYISSWQNPLIKLIKSLENAHERKKQKLFIIEGLRELQLAWEGGYHIEKLIFPANQFNAESVTIYLDKHSVLCKNIFLLDENIFNKLAYRSDNKNVLAIAKAKQHDLKDLKLPENPLILVLENIEKPGNLGAILRTCDAAGIDAVIITENQTDVFNPNVVRSSLGTLFTNNLAICSHDELLTFTDEHKIKCCITTPDATKFYTETNFKEATAIIMGSEAFGVSDKWLNSKFDKILIPMNGKVDSLNVSVSAAIIIYEAVRQRNSDG